MRWLAAGMLLLQLGAGQKTESRAEPKFFRFVRELRLPGSAAGQTCAVLDAAVFAHAADRAGNDLRLYAVADTPGSAEQETQFALTESAPEPGDMEQAVESHEQVHGGDVMFELAMPARPYSVINLQIGLQNFIAKAEVTALRGAGAERLGLGTVTLFDLTAQGLPRSTELRLAETSEPRLQVKLAFFDEHGKALGHVPPQVVSGASVPPSREAQVLYTPIARTTSFASDGEWTYATLQVAEHVPVDRMSIELAPSFHGDFLRELSIGARPAGNVAIRGTAPGMAESIPGSITRVTRPNPGPGMSPIHFEQLHIPLALGSNLRSPAKVSLGVHNRSAGQSVPPLPLRAVLLEMRRRTVCFEAQPGMQYRLRYGDAALRAPLDDYTRAFKPVATPLITELGPERANPSFAPRTERRSYVATHPELLWTALIAAIALTGVLVVNRMERGRRSR